MATGEVSAERLKLGPIDEVPDCYSLTRLAEGSNVFWSFPDLLAIWPTAGINGERELTVSVHRISDGAPVAVVGNTSLTLFLDNNRPDVEFNQIQLRDRLGTIGGGIDLLANACAMVDLSDRRQLYLRYTAYHPYLRHYRLRVESNAGNVQNWARGTYAGTAIGTDPAGDVLTKTSRISKRRAFTCSTSTASTGRPTATITSTGSGRRWLTTSSPDLIPSGPALSPGPGVGEIPTPGGEGWVRADQPASGSL